MAELLEMKNVSVSFSTPDGELQAVRDVSLTLQEGEILAIVGESGCGKSVLCKNIMKLLPDSAVQKNGTIRVCGEDITDYSEKEMQNIRGAVFAMVFQDPMTSLNPTLPIGKQIEEAIRVHNKQMTRQQIHKKMLELMELVGIDFPEERCRMYPGHFSGGMRQRTVLAIALASDPKILIADEPTTALDVTIQAQILDLICEIQKKLHTATILITHDLGVVARCADRVAVMYAGKIVESAMAEEIFQNPQHPYTKGLLKSLPALTNHGEFLHTIPGMPPVLINPPAGDAFAYRNKYALEIDYEKEPPEFPVSATHSAATWLLDPRAEELKDRIQDISVTYQEEAKRFQVNHPVRDKEPVHKNEPLLKVEHLTYQFQLSKKHRIRAVNDLSLTIYKGEILGLVGESGSGKSTAARCFMNILQPRTGSMTFRNLNLMDHRTLRKHRIRLSEERQMIFQDSASSLNPRMTIGKLIAEPLHIHHKKPEKRTVKEEVLFQMETVGLDPSIYDKYPTQLSGGQRQRAAIARALIMNPELIIADEPVSALDVSIQAQIINLFQHLQKEHGFTILFIAHDLAMVRYLCDRVGVMCKGRLVELAKTEDLFVHPTHGYTKALLSAIPIPDPEAERGRKLLRYDESELQKSRGMEEIAPDHFVLTEGSDRT